MLSNAVFLNGGDTSRKTRVFGVCKLYDTYVGSKDFGDNKDEDLKRLGSIGEEYGSTTGRRRKCNWLNLRKLIKACEINKVYKIYVNKCDIINKLGIFKLFDTNDNLQIFDTYVNMIIYIQEALEPHYIFVFSGSKEKI